MMLFLLSDHSSDTTAFPTAFLSLAAPLGYPVLFHALSLLQAHAAVTGTQASLP